VSITGFLSRREALNHHHHVTVSKLVGVDARILVPGLDDLVAPLTDEERKRYEVINFGIKVRVVWPSGER
jgi:hypothetical protein